MFSRFSAVRNHQLTFFICIPTERLPRFRNEQPRIFAFPALNTIRVFDNIVSLYRRRWRKRTESSGFRVLCVYTICEILCDALRVSIRLVKTYKYNGYPVVDYSCHGANIPGTNRAQNSQKFWKKTYLAHPRYSQIVRNSYVNFKST